MKSVILVIVAVMATARCGILERGFDTFGDAAHIAHEGLGDIIETGKDLMFGKGIRAGPDPADQGLIPGMIHTMGDGVHLVGDGISHIFAGDDAIHAPLSEMRGKLAASAAAAPVAAAAPLAAAPLAAAPLAAAPLAAAPLAAAPLAAAPLAAASLAAGAPLAAAAPAVAAAIPPVP